MGQREGEQISGLEICPISAPLSFVLASFSGEQSTMMLGGPSGSGLTPTSLTTPMENTSLLSVPVRLPGMVPMGLIWVTCLPLNQSRLPRECSIFFAQAWVLLSSEGMVSTSPDSQGLKAGQGNCKKKIGGCYNQNKEEGIPGDTVSTWDLTMRSKLSLERKASAF